LLSASSNHMWCAGNRPRQESHMTNAEATNRTTTETTAQQQETPAAASKTAVPATPAKGKPAKTATARAQGAPVAPGMATSRKTATAGRKRAAAGKKAIKLSAAKNPTKKPAKVGKPPKAGAPRPDSKAAKVLAMIGKKSGATITELGKATGWQPHTLRAFISVATRKHGLKIQTSQNSAGERTYRIGR
jgi:hypothetical protein